MKFGVSQSVARKEDVRFLTGAGRYIDDIPLEGTLRAALLRSPVAHGRITHLDTSAARAAPGVRLVFTWDDVKDRLAPLACRMPMEQRDGTPISEILRPHLSDGTVRYVGQAIAFVVADTLDQAKDACELIEVDFDELDAVVDSRAALEEGAPELHPEAPGNQCYDWVVGEGEQTEAAFAAAAHVASQPFTNSCIDHAKANVCSYSR